MSNRELRAVPAMRAVAVVLACLVANGVVAQEKGEAKATPTELLVRWLQGRREDGQFAIFHKYRSALPAKDMSWIAALDNDMRDFGRNDAAPLPPAPVAAMLTDLQKVYAAAEPLHPYLPWLLLAAGANGDDLRLRWLAFAAMAEPGVTLDAECADEYAVIVRSALGDDAKGALASQRDALLGWLPELEGFTDAGARLAFFRGAVDGFVERLKSGAGIEPGALRRARVAQLDAQFLAEVKAAKGDPFAVVERMRKMAPGDVTNDLIYLLLAGSEGRKGDKERQKEVKASRERFDKAWKEREKNGLDVVAMKARLAAVGVEQACRELGIGFDPAALARLPKDGLQWPLLMFPTADGLDKVAKEANRDVVRIEGRIGTADSSRGRFEAAAKDDEEKAKGWRRREAAAGNVNDKRHYAEEARNKEASAKTARENARRKGQECDSLGAELRNLKLANRSFEVRRRTLFGD